LLVLFLLKELCVLTFDLPTIIVVNLSIVDGGWYLWCVGMMKHWLCDTWILKEFRVCFLTV
jgi:hypothetical protein